MKTLTVDRRVKDFLTDAEIEQFLTAARKRTHDPRDFFLAPLIYRHGFRVPELVDVRLEEVNLKTARLFALYLFGLRGDREAQADRYGQKHPAVRSILRPASSA